MVIKNTDASQNGQSGFNLFEVWQEYQKVAMHFNDLLIRIRSQSLAAVAAFATVAGVVVKGETVGAELRWGTMTAVFATLSIFWLAMWILDFTYYNRLLLGAVRALLEIENASKSGIQISELVLSTHIEAEVQKSDSLFSRKYWKSAKGRWFFYILVYLVLLAGTIISIHNWSK